MSTHLPADRATLVAHLARRFGLLDGPAVGRVCAAPDPGAALAVEAAINGDQINELDALAALLETRHADRELADSVTETGHASEDEIEFAFGGQEQAWRRDRSVRSVGDLLVEFGSIEPDMRDELLARQGRG